MSTTECVQESANRWVCSPMVAENAAQGMSAGDMAIVGTGLLLGIAAFLLTMYVLQIALDWAKR